MNYRPTASFWADYRTLTKKYRKKADKAFKLFQENPKHPSFETHHIKGTSKPKIWEGKLDDGYRFTFHYEKDTIVFRRIGKHEIIDEDSGKKK